MPHSAFAQIIAVGAYVVCLWVIVRCLYNLKMAIASRTWILVEGFVLDAHVAFFRNWGGEDHYLPNVRNRYIVGGRTYISTRMKYPIFDDLSFREATQAIENVRVGSIVDAYYDPTKPSRSVLVCGNIGSNIELLFMSFVPPFLFFVLFTAEV